MSDTSKIFITEQTALTQLTFSQIQQILSENDVTIYVDSNNKLRIAEKKDGVFSDKNATGDMINSLSVGEIGENFPPIDVGYSLMAVRDGSNYKLIWGLVDTKLDYNVITSNTMFFLSINDPNYQIYDENTPGDYKFNGSISISVTGDGSNVGKYYSFDNGLTFSTIQTGSTYNISELGSMTGDTFNFVVEDFTETVIHTDTITLAPADYSWQFIDSGLYTPPGALDCIVYKTNDFNSQENNGFIIKLIVGDDNGYYSALYTYMVYLDGDLVYELNNTALKEIFVGYDELIGSPITPPGTLTVQVTRKNSGYVELGDISRSSGFLDNAANLLWSKDFGGNFSSPSLNQAPITYDINNLSVRVNYNPIEIENNINLIYMLRNLSEVYQYTHSLSPSDILANQLNSLLVYEISGTTSDTKFASVILSDDYDNPTLIYRDSGLWTQTGSPPEFTRLSFDVFYIDASFVDTAAQTQLYFRFEDLSGNLLADNFGDLIEADPKTGLKYNCKINDFDQVMSLINWDEYPVRLRFTFTPDTTISPPQPQNDILSNLKYVKFFQ